MTPQQHQATKRLLTLADAAAEFEMVDLKLVNHFHTMREELGLAKLLLLIQEYVTESSRPTTEVPEIHVPHQDKDLV